MKEFTEYNFHTHTYRCKHAHGSETEYIESAIKNGIRVLGFADHVPCPNRFTESIRMDMQTAPEYVYTLRALKEKYKNDIDIYIGFEAEYIPEFYEEQLQMCRELECDYMIMGQHFTSGGPEAMYTGAPTRDTENIKKYVDSVLEGAATGNFMYIAHPDLINFTGDKKIYISQMRRMCEGLKEMDIPVEINSKGMAVNNHYPNPLFWEIAGQVGNKAVIGIDAHSVADMENTDAVKRCRQLAAECGVELLTEAQQVLDYMHRKE